MQQRQLRLGDILDDYCPRERRVTNHAIVAMVGDTVKQTRCTTCDADHEYKHAKVPRQRRKSDAPAALYAQVAAGAPGAPKRVTHETPSGNGLEPIDGGVEMNGSDDAGGHSDGETPTPITNPNEPTETSIEDPDADGGSLDEDGNNQDDGPIHRRLIRASLPRPEGQQPPARPIPEFTIRQPNTGRPNRFRQRHRGGQGGQQGQHGHQFGGGNRSNGNMGGVMRGPRPNAGRPGAPGAMKRHGPGGGGRKRSK